MLQHPCKPDAAAAAGTAESCRDHYSVIIFGMMGDSHGAHSATPRATEVIAVQPLGHVIIRPRNRLRRYGGHMRAAMAVVELCDRIVDREVPHHAFVTSIG